jgi:hypothetical protein
MNKKVYLVVGKARNGKDTVAQIAMQELQKRGVSCTHLAFASLLKKQAEAVGWDGKKDQKGRTLLQHLGDVAKEYHGNDYYAGNTLGEVLVDNEHNVFFITDCRFKEEVNLFKTCGLISTVMVRVIRPGFKSDLSEEQQNHKSEIDLDDVKEDYLILNDSDENVLRRKVIEFLDSEETEE